MKDQHEKIISALNNILQFLNDSASCFAKHVENVNHPGLKKSFTDMANSRRKMMSQIQLALAQYGSEKEVKGTLLGKTHMVFENIKSMLTHGDPLAITKEVRRGENVLIDYYKKAAILPVDEKLKQLLLSHIATIEDDIKKSDLQSIS